MVLKIINNALLGAFMSVTAIYLLIVGHVLIRGITGAGWSGLPLWQLFVGIPVYTIMFIDWILIPIGVAVGLLTPLLVRKKTRRGSILYGLIIGLVIGLIFAGLSAHDFANGTALPNDTGARWWALFWGEVAHALPPAIGYSSIWTTAYALMKSGEVKSLPENQPLQLGADGRITET